MGRRSSAAPLTTTTKKESQEPESRRTPRSSSPFYTAKRLSPKKKMTEVGARLRGAFVAASVGEDLPPQTSPANEANSDWPPSRQRERALSENELKLEIKEELPLAGNSKKKKRGGGGGGILYSLPDRGAMKAAYFALEEKVLTELEAEIKMADREDSPKMPVAWIQRSAPFGVTVVGVGEAGDEVRTAGGRIEEATA
ncbi:unnamed protein product [Linum trigynum]|uniref:Uncharacterized protein n=1 Tax=Linum trigynum TaxID=586398 RepID=A0AAV2FAK7_9ROSI